MLKLVFCDPSERNRAQLDKVLADYAKAEEICVRGFGSVAAFITYMERCGDSTDVVIASIEMDGISGIRLMGAIHERLPNLQIIFVSKYPEMIYDALCRKTHSLSALSSKGRSSGGGTRRGCKVREGIREKVYYPRKQGTHNKDRLRFHIISGERPEKHEHT